MDSFVSERIPEHLRGKLQQDETATVRQVLRQAYREAGLTATQADRFGATVTQTIKMKAPAGVSRFLWVLDKVRARVLVATWLSAKQQRQLLSALASVGKLADGKPG